MTRMRGVAFVAVTVLAACTRGEPVPTVPTTPGLPTGTEPLVRVGIDVDTDTSSISSSAAFVIEVAGGAELARGRAGEVFTFRNDAGRLSARSDRGQSIAPQDGLVRVRADNDTVRIGARAYRGAALLRTTDDGVTAINVLDLEQYLLGVVPREIGRRPANEIEAIKAQAVAARTYAIGNMNGRASLGFDFYATVSDQVYGGVADEDSIVSRGVRETRGEVLMYDGRPILAYYASTCGGRTAAIEESWPWRGPLPYLKSVSDRIPGSDEYYCSTSNRFHWETEWTRAQLLDVLGETLAAYTRNAVRDVERVTDVRVVARNDSERATIEITADGRSYVVRADSVRRVLRPEGAALLNSSRIDDIDAVRDGDGAVQSLTVRGGGWGHAIGMCQVGAMGRARAGQSYREILGAYYRGAELERLF